MLIVSFIELIDPVLSVFIVCEIFERISGKFESINAMINQYEWYLFPTRLQKLLPIVLFHAQQPVSVKCFGSIPCNRETFKKVLNADVFRIR